MKSIVSLLCVGRGASVAVLLTLAFIANGGAASAFPAATSGSAARSVMMDFPSRAEYGVVAHYRVYRTQPAGARAQLVVLQVQTTPEYLAALHAVPVANAVIRYPDGSVQRADANGGFDAAASAYARAHPQRTGQPDAAVRVSAPAGDGLAPIVARVATPSARVEAATASGVIADTAGTLAQTMQAADAFGRPARAMQPAYAFSCDPAKYIHGTINVTSGSSWRSPSFVAEFDYSYYPLFGFCGVENSFLGASYVSAVRHWSQSHTIEVSKGQVPGCIGDVGRPLVRSSGVAYFCVVRTWYADATFATNVDWSGAKVALWFEAWNFNVFRSHSADRHLALLQVS